MVFWKQVTPNQSDVGSYLKDSSNKIIGKNTTTSSTIKAKKVYDT